jgi:hypothetical protein
VADHLSAESAKVEDFAASARILVKMPLPDAIWSNGIGTSVVGTGGFLLTDKQTSDALMISCPYLTSQDSALHALLKTTPTKEA